VRLEDLNKPSIPIAYGLLILEVTTERGVAREKMLAGLGIAPELLQTPDARLTLLQAGQLLYRALKLVDDPALGYEIGLRSSLTSHGFIGYGVMSAPSLREATEFGSKFLPLRLPNLSIRLLTEGAQGVIDVTETTPLGDVRRVMFDLFLVGLWRMVPALTQGALKRPDVELRFDYPEPDYYARYRERLPRMRFATGANQIRFPAEFLDRPLYSANAVTAELVTQQLERELSLLGFTRDLAGRVRAALVLGRGGYPSLDKVASRLHVSPRTLKRKLQQHGTSFQLLLDEARRRDSLRLIEDPTLTLAAVGERVGYSDPASFTRAFRKWTQQTPSAYRAGLAQKRSSSVPVAIQRR
jgi:AraC-like DNA-binding protein